MGRTGDRVLDRVGDVVGIQRLDLSRSVPRGALSLPTGCGSGSVSTKPGSMIVTRTPCRLASAERLADRSDTVLGQVVDPAPADATRPATELDVDHIRHAAG